MSRPRVLVVYDDSLSQDLLGFLLGEHCDVTIARSHGEALAIIDGGRVDAVVVNHSPPEHDGISFLEKARRGNSLVRRILIGSEDASRFDGHLKAGLLQTYLPRPAKLDDVLACLKSDIGSTMVAPSSQVPKPQEESKDV